MVRRLSALSCFVGAVSLGIFGFQAVIQGIASFLGSILLILILRMPSGLPTGRKDAKFKEVISKNPNVNWLSLARVFLFGARDVWFVVGIPIYFYGVLSDGSHEGNRAAFFQIGTFMALWIIGYGAVQAYAPKLLKAAHATLPEIVARAIWWVGLLTLIPLALAGAAWAELPELTAVLVVGLLLFGFVFAVNSSVHSYLILAFSSAERVTMDVGFYYMSNAMGRLIGTLLSGVSYQVGGLPLCLATAAAMAGASFLAARGLQES